jgi:hypothetical protein
VRKPLFRRALLLALIVAIWLLAEPVLAGTTGGISGVVLDGATGAPVAGAKVEVVSPSQTVSVTTDAGGHFAFISLSPDTYIVSVDKTAYDASNLSGINVLADQQQRLTLRIEPTLKTIGRVQTRSAGLVRGGTVTDVYSVNPTTQAAVAGSNGGGSLNQAFSALAVTPGVSVPAGSSGWSQMAGVTIRGGTHSEIGYEFDGVPANVGVNNFPGNNLSTLGQQELQVYTGSAPATSGTQGLSGFVNQVIKTGTYPGFTNVDLGFGSPSFYHKLSVEVGGETVSRNFSWYAGYLQANQTFRYVDQFNGAGVTASNGFAYGALPCPGNASNLNYASCYKAVTPGGLSTGTGNFVNFPVNWLSPNLVQDQEAIANLHYYFPVGKNGIKDDLQLLYQTGMINSYSYSSANDLGVTPYAYPQGNVYTCGVGQFLPANYKSCVGKYVSAFSSGQTLVGANVEDEQQNPTSTVKLQLQHNFGTNAFLRVYGYTLYSLFGYNSPNGANNPAAPVYGNPPDYQLWTHTSGVSALFADQLNDKNFLQLQFNDIHEPSVKDNDTTAFTGSTTPFAVVVNGNDPNSGLCYSVSGGVASAASCQKNQGATQLTYAGASAGAVPSLAGASCGGGPCKFYVVENGQQGLAVPLTQNQYAASLSDQFKPTANLTINAGIRYDAYQINGANTQGGTTPFWFNAYNQDYCVNALPGNSPVAKTSLGIGVTAACSAASSGGITYAPVTMLNSPVNYYFSTWEPRIGATYALGSRDVLRADYGQYAQPPSNAYQQYATLQQNLPAYLGPRFYKLGYYGSGHALPPQVSTNIDASWEHAFKGTDTSFKVTPFYRTTRNEIAEFYIDPATQLTSGLPVGSLTAGGIEFLLQKGSFERDGFAAQLAYTYTSARSKYYTLPGGGSILSPINNDIQTYNGYTSFCAKNPSDSRCGPTNTKTGTAAACFTAGGAADPSCAAGDFANPYWNAPVQNTLDPNGSYWPTDLVVATTGLGVNSYTVPQVLALVLNYKHGPFSITPTFQVQGGQRYGAPEANAGIDPAGGCSALGGSTAGDPRYPYGGAGGAPYDALTCGAALNAIPDTYTGKFDGIGAFVSPTQLLGSLTMRYQATKSVGISLTVANLINQCFGGSKEPWTGAGSPHTCSYESGEISRSYAPTGNVYNPGAQLSPFAALPYYPYLGPYTMGIVNPSGPISAYLGVSFKLR